MLTRTSEIMVKTMIQNSTSISIFHFAIMICFVRMKATNNMEVT